VVSKNDSGTFDRGIAYYMSRNDLRNQAIAKKEQEDSSIRWFAPEVLADPGAALARQTNGPRRDSRSATQNDEIVVEVENDYIVDERQAVDIRRVPESPGRFSLFLMLVLLLGLLIIPWSGGYSRLEDVGLPTVKTADQTPRKTVHHQSQLKRHRKARRRH